MRMLLANVNDELATHEQMSQLNSSGETRNQASSTKQSKQT